jgi:hypothetical protein
MYRNILQEFVDDVNAVGVDAIEEWYDLKVTYKKAVEALSGWYEVQEDMFCGGWTNAWTDQDDEPVRYDSRQAAQNDLDEFLSGIEDQIQNGERQPDEGYDADTFRVALVSESDSHTT